MASLMPPRGFSISQFTYICALQDAIELYQIRESFLPHRSPAPDAHPNRWIPVARQQ